jgi:RHS repeat-associated protein
MNRTRRPLWLIILFLAVAGRGFAQSPQQAAATTQEPAAAASSSALAASQRHLPVRSLTYGIDGESGAYSYDGSGNIIGIGSDAFLYDAEGRLKQATVRGVLETYIYDEFGNRQSATGATNCLGGSPCAAPVNVSSSTNHLTSSGGLAVTYDDAGSVKAANGASYVYDGTGMMVQTTAGSDDRQYVYTADDERIGIRQGASWTWTVRDPGGKVLREFAATESTPLTLTSTQWSKDYVWRDGLLLASVAPVTPGSSTLLTYHYHLDHLGTPRLITDSNHVRVAEHAYYPFGSEFSVTPHESPEEAMKFTGHERDIVAGNYLTLDDMHARYYTASTGRFLSVDPLEGNSSKPQSLNRYAYVLNNPGNLVDPFGLEDILPTLTNPVECGSPENPCNIDVPGDDPTKSKKPKLQLPTPRQTTWYEDNVAEFARARLEPLLKNRSMPHLYGRTPDYYTLTIGVTSQYFVGGGGLLALDRNGRLYAGPVGLIGTPGRGVALVAGWLMTPDAPDPDTLTNFITGYSASFALSGGLQAGFSWGGPGLGFAQEYGLGIPGFGPSPSWSFGPLETDLSWPEK